MDTIDKVLLEWSLKTDKGYPDLNSKEDMDLFESMFGIRLNEETISQDDNDYVEDPKDTDLFIKKDPQTGEPTSTAERFKIVPSGKGRSSRATKYVKVVSKEEEKSKVPADENYVLDVLDKAGVESKDIDKIKKHKLFRKAENVENYVGNKDEYMKAFSYLHKYKIEGGGKGELIPFVSIKEARIGGPNEKDITDRNKKVIEVKDFSSGNEFSLASGGTILNTAFYKNFQTFKKAVKSYNKSIPQFRWVIPGNTSELSISKTYLRQLKELLQEFPLNSDSIDKAYDEIKIKGKKYLVRKGQEYSIKLDNEGKLILSDNSPKSATDEETALRKLMNHPWVTKESSPEGDLSKIKTSGLEGINYLMLFLTPTEAVILNMEKDHEDRNKIIPNRITKGILNLQYSPAK